MTTVKKVVAAIVLAGGGAVVGLSIRPPEPAPAFEPSTESPEVLCPELGMYVLRGDSCPPL